MSTATGFWIIDRRLPALKAVAAGCVMPHSKEPADMSEKNSKEPCAPANAGDDDKTGRPDASDGTAHTAGHRFRAAELDRHIGERMRFIRRLSGFSQQHVADEIGLSFQQIQKYESGCNRVSAALLAELSSLFRLPMDWFIGPYNTCMERDDAPDSTTYADILGQLFRAMRDRNELQCDAALDLVCVIAKVKPGRPETRLARLRHRILANGTEANVLLTEIVNRLAEARAAVAGARRPAAWEKKAALNGVTGRLNVLLVDDDPDILRTLTASLSAAGFAVQPVRSGDEALTALGSAAPIDVMVTDFAMVGMDGVELLDEAARIRPGLPGLVITGYADSGRLRALPPHIEVLSKPFRRMELIGRLRLMVEEGLTARPMPAKGPFLKLVT